MFLGHVVKNDGITVDLTKIEVARNWSRPTIVLKVKSFLDLIGYYGRFVWGFSNIAMSITKLLRKDKKFE